MSIDVDNAIFARWNAADLDSTIATLYPGDAFASPEATELPRASYESQNDPLTHESRATLVRVKRYTFHVWDTTIELVGAHLKAIEDAMLNSENSASSPLAMTTGGVIRSTHYGNESKDQVDDAMWHGQYEMDVRWTRAKVTP